jgi:purine nucleosidase/pyrimidine-specific ribonucleoside hydrolase
MAPEMTQNIARRAVVIDTDPGVDDAVAILLALACPEFDVLGLTTVAGNLGLETTTRNAGRLLSYAGRADIPVIAGAKAPLRRQGFEEHAVHGGDGLGGVAFPEPVQRAADDAVGWLATGLLALPPGTIDILALGPMTNIAALMRERPEAARRIGRIVAMGGAIHEKGNVGPRSEFNIANDPEAAEIVFGSGVPVTLIPLDVTRKVRADRACVARLNAGEAPGAQAVGKLIEAYFQGTEGRESRPLHDPCVMLYALRPDLFGVKSMGIAVDLSDGEEAGALNVDAAGHHIDVAITVDGPGVLEYLAERLRT